VALPHPSEFNLYATLTKRKKKNPCLPEKFVPHRIYLTTPPIPTSFFSFFSPPKRWSLALLYPTFPTQLIHLAPLVNCWPVTEVSLTLPHTVLQRPGSLCPGSLSLPTLPFVQLVNVHKIMSTPLFAILQLQHSLRCVSCRKAPWFNSTLSTMTHTAW